MERQDEMELRFDEECEKDPLLKLNAIASQCIEQIGCLCGICWDDPPEGISHELYQLAEMLDSLPTLAQHGWALLPQLDRDLIGAADGVVSVCGVVATNAHQAVLRLADMICCYMFSRSAFIKLTPDARRGYIDPKDAKCLRERLGLLLEEPESYNRECEAVFREYEGLWKRVHTPLTAQEIERLGTMVQREYVNARNHPAKHSTPAAPAAYLTNWREILVALDMSNNSEDREKVRNLNDKYGGPILFPGQGVQPKVERTKFIEWWNALEVQWTTRSLGQARDVKPNTESQYEYGRAGTVVPEISGAVKKRRKDHER